ncbi:MAG: hypothetical protein ACLQFR_31630 [Streptosporangiaceae bacterium]
MMIRSAGRRRFAVTLALAVTAAGVIALGAYGPWRQKYVVALPPPSASPGKWCGPTSVRWTLMTAQLP